MSRGIARSVVIPAPAGIQGLSPTTLDSRVRGNDDPIRGNDDLIRGNDDLIRGNDDLIRGNDDPVRGNDDFMLRAMNRRGMTLMELMAGIIITAIATAAGFGTFSTIIDSRERATESTRAVQSAASNRNLLASWFAAGRYVRDSATAIPSMNFASSEPDDVLRIITTAPTPLGSQQTQVYLYIDRDPFTPETGLVAEFTALNQPIDSVLMMVVSKKMEINASVMGMEVLLLDPTTRDWVSPLDLPTGTPLGMSITLFAEWRDTIPALLRLPFVYPLGTTR